MANRIFDPTQRDAGEHHGGDQQGAALPDRQRSAGGGEHQQRPMPEIQAVRPPTEPDHGLARQQSMRPGDDRGLAPDQDPHRSDDRPQGDGAGEVGARPKGQNGADDQRQAEPAGAGPEPLREPADVGGGDGQSGSGQELPRSGRQQVERPRRVPRRQPHRQPKRYRTNEGDGGEHESARLSADPRQDCECQRPDEVELLLDRQRPEVQQG